MTEKKKPKVIILHNDDEILGHAGSVLSQSGWEVTCERTSAGALARLEKSQNSLFTLFICDSKLPKMEGDDILQQVSKISPLTQRMLMIPTNDPEMLINAINKANIHSCITIPFSDSDIVGQAKRCFKNFKQANKKEQLQRVTSHQNKQMFKIAQKLKKKNKNFENLITKKKAEIVTLKSEKHLKGKQQDFSSLMSLDDFIDHKAISPEPDAFKQEFLFLCTKIKTLFNPVINKFNIEADLLDIGKAFSQDTPETQEENSEIDQDAPGTEEEQQEKPQETDQGQVEKRSEEKPEQDDETPVPAELIDSIIKKAFQVAITSGSDEDDNAFDESVVLETESDSSEETEEHPLEKYFQITASEDQVKAYIKNLAINKDNPVNHSLTDVLDLLRHKQVSYGILDDEAIETWLSKSTVDQIVIAEGEQPEQGKDGKVDYHFEINYTNPGKINQDGSIDFRDRGSIPYVSANDLIAQKTPPIAGRPGLTVSGTDIPVDEVDDPVFQAGPGTKLSEDGLSIHASIDGQPHLDAMGVVSVNPEIVIPGDVDFESGNVEFKGNIIVKGMVKEGFSVKGINLYVQEIEGGIIDLTGDLYVSAGITAAKITTQGNVHAKFINNSKVTGFGDLTISKEIIDSDICISGKCDNPAGHIISSTLTAKLGIEAGKIGTTSSKASKISVGVDEHIQQIKAEIEKALEESISKSGQLKEKIKELEDQEQELYMTISEKAHIQDRAQIEIKELHKNLKELKEKNDIAAAQKVNDKIKKKNKQAQHAEEDLNKIFDLQDQIAIESKTVKDQIEVFEEKNKKLVLEKRALKKYAEKEKPVPVLTVSKDIVVGTIIKGPHSSIILSGDNSRCRIQEIMSQENGIRLYDMKTDDL